MSKVEEIEAAIRSLTPEGLADFRAWFASFDARLWDERLEADVAAGRLDRLADEALSDLSGGRTRPL